MQDVVDTLPMLVDTVPVVVDTLPTVAKDLSDAVGQLVGAQVGALFSIVMGFALKFVTDWSKKASNTFAASPDYVKAIAVLVFGQLSVWVTKLTGVAIDPNIANLEATMVGLVVAGVAMGIHGLLKAFGWKVTLPTK